MPNHIKNQLTVKPVTPNYIEQYNELMRYVFQVTKHDIEESGYEDGELIRSKLPVLKEARVLGWFTQADELISSICTYPFKVNIHGQIYEMGGVTGVGTYPEYANMGLMNDLILLTLQEMRKCGQYISYLFPYSIPYYRKKGWEIMSDRMTFSLKDSQIPKYIEVPGHVQRLEVLDQAVIDVYNRFAQTTHGAMLRSSFGWAEYWRWENEDDRTAGVYFDAENNAQGYLFYWVENDIFHIKEMVYMTQEARHGLWNFVKAHYSMIDVVEGTIYTNEPLAFLLEESHLVETIEPYYMARVVDVEGFLKAYPYDDEINEFHFNICDSLADWNNRTFGLKQAKNGGVEITDKPVGNAVELDIQTFSTLMMSYKSPAYLHKIGRLKTDLATLRLLEKIIPTEKPYFADYF